MTTTKRSDADHRLDTQLGCRPRGYVNCLRRVQSRLIEQNNAIARIQYIGLFGMFFEPAS